MNNLKEKVLVAARFLMQKTCKLPRIGVITGTGLGYSSKFLEISHQFEYTDIPHFPVSTVESHVGRLILGNLGDKEVIAFQGRFHLYEGYVPSEVIFPIRVMQELGVRILILNNASGGLNPAFSPGDIMIITDHINLTGENPLIGKNEESWGNRFPDMSRAYDKKLAFLTEKIATSEAFSIQKGIYAGLKGPSLETPAEIRFLQFIGAEAVGFSTVQEVIAAVHAGIRVLGLSTITNVHNPEAPLPATVEEIIAVAETAAPQLKQLIKTVIEQIDDNELS
jgi:purine-nucleoside phosphorylase